MVKMDKFDENVRYDYFQLVSNDTIGGDIYKISFDDKLHQMYLNHDLDNSKNVYSFEVKRFKFIRNINELFDELKKDTSPIFFIESLDGYIYDNECVNDLENDLVETLKYSDNPEQHYLLKIK